MNQTRKIYSSEMEKPVQHVRCLPNLPVESTMRAADSAQTIGARVSPHPNFHTPGAPKFGLFGHKAMTDGSGCKIQDENVQPGKIQPKVSSTTHGCGGSSHHTSPDSQYRMDYCGSEKGGHSSPSSDFDGQYKFITSLEQRARYKADFNAEYENYLYLHSRMISVSQRFAALEDQLNAFDEGSVEYRRIKAQIYREYKDNKNDPKYEDIRKKWNFLHRKLSHIKRLVMEYDNAQFVDPTT